MIHYGDITKINGAEVPIVDIVTGGSPCQDLSVAGKRAGLAGERSGLFMEQIRVIKEMRDYDRSSGRADVDIRPRFMVWENVPGAFSSNHGEDFRAVLEETAKIADSNAVIPEPPKGKWTHAGCIMGDGWSIAWRVHDAQFWGVPQRRKRISLVADFAGGGAPEILFEREGVSGNPAESREQGEGSATDVGSGVEETGRVAISFQERAGKPGGGKGILIQNERTGALSTLNNQSVVYGISAYDSNSMKSENPNSGIYEAETARTLDLNGGSPACNQGGMAVVSMATKQLSQNIGDNVAMPICANDYKEPQVVCLEGNGSRPSHQGDGWHEGDPMYTLNSTEHHAVAYRKQGHPQNAEQGQGWEQTEINDTLNAFDSGESRTPTVVRENHPADSRVKISEDGMVQTLSGRMGTGGNNVPMVMYPEKTTESLMASGYDKLGTQEAANDMYVVQNVMAMQAIGEYKESEAASSLKQRDYKDATDLVVASFYPQMKAESQCYREDDISNTLVNGTNPGFQNGVCYGLDRAAYNQGMNAQFDFAVDEEKIGTQVAKGPGAVCNNYVVRRLTPMECERLQGFPDYWTDIGEWVDSKGKKHKDADSPRYKALGNSIALPFWQWMAKRMRRYLGDKPTMASLFSGIGGFEVVFQRSGVIPVWASEVEEFAIAVTKRRFPDGEMETSSNT